MSSCNESSTLNWEMKEGAFTLYQDGKSCGSMVYGPSGYDVNIGSCLFQISKKGLIRPHLTINGPDGRELGRVTGLNQFELRIELATGGKYLHRVLKEGVHNYAIFDFQDALVLETQNRSTWKSPSMHIDLYQTDLTEQVCAYLAATSLFIFLYQCPGSSRLNDDNS